MINQVQAEPDSALLSASHECFWVEPTDRETADQQAFRNLRWLSRFQKPFAHLSEFTEGGDLVAGVAVSHDASDLGHEDVDLCRIKAWVGVVCPQELLGLLNQLIGEDLAFSRRHVNSLVQGGEA